MVQIRREAVYGRTISAGKRLLNCLRFLALSAAIPFLFLVRYLLKGGHLPAEVSLEEGLLALASPSEDAATETAATFSFLEHVDFTVDHNLHGSDIVELHHCDLVNFPWVNFTAWAYPLLNSTLHHTPNDFPHSQRQELQEEFVLELLEQYAADHQFCDYSLYRPTVYGHEEQGTRLKATFSDGVQRLAVVIIAFQDVDHLAALVEAIYEPQNIILIHMERHADSDFRRSVLDMAETYENVVVLQFGTITYRTDSVSMINLRIIRWITLDLQLEYDYVLLMDGSAYPLVSTQQLLKELRTAMVLPDSSDEMQPQERRQVWLGELTHKNERVVEVPSNLLLRHKRLIYTGNNQKLHKRLKYVSDEDVLSQTIRYSMVYKSTSGNQGIYSHHVIHQLLASDDVMEIFALSKYGCCCCIEERNWIAALAIIGFEKEALQQTSMFQVWGGVSEECKSTMNNAVLDRNKTLCYKSEDPERPDTSTPYFRGSELWGQLLDARRRHFLFARKFRSASEESQELVTAIQDELWDADMDEEET